MRTLLRLQAAVLWLMACISALGATPDKATDNADVRLLKEIQSTLEGNSTTSAISLGSAITEWCRKAHLNNVGRYSDKAVDAKATATLTLKVDDPRKVSLYSLLESARKQKILEYKLEKDPRGEHLVYVLNVIWYYDPTNVRIKIATEGKR